MLLLHLLLTLSAKGGWPRKLAWPAGGLVVHMDGVTAPPGHGVAVHGRPLCRALLSTSAAKANTVSLLHTRSPQAAALKQARGARSRVQTMVD